MCTFAIVARILAAPEKSVRAVFSFGQPLRKPSRFPIPCRPIRCRERQPARELPETNQDASWPISASTRWSCRWRLASSRPGFICFPGRRDDPAGAGAIDAGDLGFGDDCDCGWVGMTATIIQFVPRKSTDRRPMLEQMAHDVINQITAPKCHDDLEGGSILEYESSLGYFPKDPA